MSNRTELSTSLPKPGVQHLLNRVYDGVPLRVHKRDRLRHKEDW